MYYHSININKTKLKLQNNVRNAKQRLALVQTTYPLLLYPVNQVLLVRVITVVHNECLEPVGCLRFDLH